MFPILEIGSLTLPVYPLVQGLGIFVACTLAFHRLIQGGIPERHASRGILLSLWGGLVGGFVFRTLISLVQSLILTGHATAHGGSTFIGIGLGGAMVGWLYARKHTLPLRRALDLGWPAVSLAQAIGRVACFAAGCCYGKRTSGPLGMYLRNVHGEWAWRYPTQLMSLVANLLIFATLLVIEHYGKRRADPGHTWPFDGFLVLLQTQLYFLKRFSVEFLRGDAVPLWGPFTLTHVACLVLFLITTGSMLKAMVLTHPLLFNTHITRRTQCF